LYYREVDINNKAFASLIALKNKWIIKQK
jgi:hypothetical protein